ncbi:MFS monocarboxylate transporter [Talaromyces proteolyticus]|uniref:MFS monocarboxylate transporter n=1 Tax=Talaromyces proteolyticus TaxID=1131652 RepID=A0AAD4KCZ6_9EURO|nr:MFS monocarboxylate transporter [Talaromyces proteolyticus]KAH8689079.1 MFS monocarboxylate transporter [Talaromyces proteolyticus]
MNELQELQPRNESSNETWQSPHEIEQPDLPPADHGKDAWLALVACVLVQVPIWGLSLVWGVFQEYLSDTNIGGNKGSIAVIGTTSSGILYMLSPITFALLTKYPRLRRYCGWAGVILSIVGFIIASFATKVWQLVVSLGVLSAIGSGLLFTPTTLYLDEWFIYRKGLALGTMWAGKSVAGVVLPFIAQASLSRFGMSNTLRAWTVLTVLMTVPLLRFIRPRLPLPPSHTPRRLDISFLRLSSFWILETSNIIQGFGYFLPSAYLSSFTTTLGFSDTLGTLMLSLFNGTSIFGGIAMGMLCDRFNVSNIILLSSAMSAVSVLLFWGLCQSSRGVVLLTLFSLTYGFFAGGFSSTWSGILHELKRENPALDTGLIFGLLAGGRGIGNVISGPISSLLMDNKVGDSSAGYSTDYGAVILFTGLTAGLAGYNGAWRMFKRLVC